jgi:hypothetical protein
MDQPLDAALAAQLGIPIVEGQPMPTMKSVMQRQMVGIMNGLTATANKNAQMVDDFQDRISGRKKGTLQPEQQMRVDQMLQVFEKYPELINATFLFAATMMRRILDQRKLLSAIPGRELELLDKIEALLRAEVPQEKWPENQAPQAQAAAA